MKVYGLFMFIWTATPRSIITADWVQAHAETVDYVIKVWCDMQSAWRGSIVRKRDKKKLLYLFADAQSFDDAKSQIMSEYFHHIFTPKESINANAINTFFDI